MNDLNNSTVEELIEKMVRKNYIDVKEKSTIDGMLRNVTGNIRDKNERILFINTLSLKLDAQNNEFVTPNGLNYASFESFLKETVDEVKKVKTAEELPTIDITEEPKKEEENFDIEKYEAEVKSNLDDLLKYIGLEGITFSTEEVAEIAEKQRVAEKIGKRFKEKLETRIDKKQALEETCQELGILQEEIESPEMLMACLNIGKKIVKEIQQEKNISEEEAEREFLDGDYFVAITMLDMCKKAGKAEKTLKSISNLILREYKTKKLEQAEAKLMKKIHDEKVTPQSLLSAIKNKMKKTQELRIIEQENDELEKKLSSEIKVKRKEFFQKLTNDFITTRKTMSEMYEELMENPDFDPEDLQYDKFEFEDVMDGIIDSLDGNVKSLLGEEHLKVLKENELIYRQYDILEKNFNVAIEDLDEKNYEFFYSYAEEKKSRTNETNEARMYFASKRGINLNSLAVNINYATKVPKPKKPTITSKEAIEERNRVSNDRNQIIKLSREQEISPNEASKIYFTQNPEALNSYSKKERKILLGENENHSTILDSSKFLLFLKKIVRRYNDRALKYVSLEIVRNQKILDEYENDTHNPKVYAYALKLAEKLNDRKRRLEESSQKLNDDKKIRTASDVIIEKEEKANKKIFLSEYVKSGKSAVEIYRDIEAKGNGSDYTFEDVLNFIEEGSKSYMTKSERKDFRKVEESIQQITIKLESFKSKKEQAANNEALKDWSTFYEKQITKFEREIAKEKAKNETYKNKLAKRRGIKRETNNQTLNDDFQQEDSKVEQNNAPLVAENIQMQEGIIPNVKKIAQNSKVTTSKVRDAFSKIKSFWRERKVLRSAENVQSQQTDLQSTQYENDEITQ